MRYRIFPGHFWGVYDRKARQAGFDHLYLVLSFDCDTDNDINAALRIHDWLVEQDARGVFAAPGVQLKKGSKIFRRMAVEGAEFINHGAAAHTEWNNGRYGPVNFYNKISLDEVERDIKDGHEIVTQVTGRPPTGFRAPHFGYFQQPDQLSWLYNLLYGLGYRYSSTTVPRFLLKYGPCANVGGLVEFPVSGNYRKPVNLFDSWGNLASHNPPSLRASYNREFINSINELRAAGVRGLINHYVDPAHVINGDYFFSAVRHAIEKGIELATFTKLLDKIHPK